MRVDSIAQLLKPDSPLHELHELRGLHELITNFIRRDAREMFPTYPLLIPDLQDEDVPTSAELLELARNENIFEELDQNYADGIEQGRTEGLKLGRAKGRELGRTEGIERGRIEGIEQGRTEGIELGHAEGLKQGRTEGIRLGHAERYELARARGHARGRPEGVVRGWAESLLTALRYRGLPASQKQHERIMAIEDEHVLQEWFARAFTVHSTDELFDTDQ
ncbi:MAG: hypothetical protein AAGF11_55710 [Myxococcota bacterium]